jgi:hypothetical protein
VRPLRQAIIIVASLSGEIYDGSKFMPRAKQYNPFSCQKDPVGLLSQVAGHKTRVHKATKRSGGAALLLVQNTVDPGGCEILLILDSHPQTP